ncbi:RING/FYVE/PHD zinc finger superfamily protein [Zea mays]|uniref:RING/FYVE/PHD zinc finger superfamily protein n=1 Tax=Zea mays TaxID=4577 RepID=A0A1D6NLY1_MAIZE|nr:RING/FYVE/PHD zinc finger superfamily protein [Zea mays]
MLERHRVHRDADGDLPAAVTAPLLAHPPSPAEPWPANFGSSEITDEEIDAASAACCRICLESESEPGDVLISPCMCKGTQQFVHRSCLDHWRSVKEGTAFSHCTTCKARFHLRVEFLEDDICRRMKFRMFVARDVIIIFLLIQATIAAIGGMAYFLDKDGNFRNKFSDDWERFLSKHPVPFYYCVGICFLL